MMTKVMTVAEFAEMNGLDKVHANSFLHVCVAQGVVKVVGSRKFEGAPGKPSTLFEVPSEMTLKVKVSAEAPVTEVAPVVETVAPATVPATEVPATAETTEAVG